MKLSEVSYEQLAAMTVEQKWDFNCGGICDEGKSAEVAILLAVRRCVPSSARVGRHGSTVRAG